MNLGVKHTFLRIPDDVLAIKFDFWHFLCPSRVISFCFGMFPCLGLRKWLKTANFAFCFGSDCKNISKKSQNNFAN